MTKELALQIIGGREDDWEEALESHIFSLKQRIIAVPFNSVLINARMNEVKRAYTVECTLNNIEESTIKHESLPEKSDYSFIESLELNLSRVKGKVMSASSVNMLYTAVLKLQELARTYEAILIKVPLIENSNTDNSRIPDPHLLKKEMQELSIEDLSDEKLHTFAGQELLLFSEKRRIAKYFK